MSFNEHWHHWRHLKLNVKRAPLMSMFIEGRIFLIFRYLKGPFTFPAFCFESCTALALNHFCRLHYSPPTSGWHSPTLMASNSGFWFQSHSWWTDFDFISLILPQCVHHLFPFESSLAPSNGSHHRTGTLWTTADCPLGQNYSAFPN